MPSITELQLLAIKAESTYGTDPVPTVGANLVAATNDSISHAVSRTQVPRKIADASFSRIKPYSILPVATVKFSYELRGNGAIQSGDSGDAVECDALLQACNLDPTYQAETGPGDGNGYVTYAPKVYPASVGPSVTIYWWAGGKLHKITGAKGTIERLRSEPEKPIIADFSFTGIYNDAADTALPESGHSWDDTVPPQLWTLQVNEGASALSGVVSMMAEFVLGNTIAQRTFAGATTPGQASGVKGFIVSGRNSTARFEIEDAAGIAPRTTWGNGSVYSVQSKAGSTAGNIVYCVFAGQISNQAFGNRQGVRTNILDVDVNRYALGGYGVLGYSEFYLRFA